MKKFIVIACVLCFISHTGFAQEKAGKVDTTKHTVLYSCPKHSDVVSDKPGKCSKCGSSLVLSQKEQMKTEHIKHYSCPVHADVTSHDPDRCPKCGKKLNLSTKEQMKAEVTKVYTCPMHPEVALTKDGVCPKCGKTLVEKKKS